MEKDQIILLEDRGLISITGEDSKNFLQNIITNDVEKVSFPIQFFQHCLLHKANTYLNFFY
jgi:folate-binding Fe-S cluster repair protein YgfZ